jgi:hypothetical protein
MNNRRSPAEKDSRPLPARPAKTTRPALLPRRAARRPEGQPASAGPARMHEFVARLGSEVRLVACPSASARDFKTRTASSMPGSLDKRGSAGLAAVSEGGPSVGAGNHHCDKGRDHEDHSPSRTPLWPVSRPSHAQQEQPAPRIEPEHQAARRAMLIARRRAALRLAAGLRAFVILLLLLILLVIFFLISILLLLFLSSSGRDSPTKGGRD